MLRIDQQADAAYIEFKSTLATRTEQFSEQVIVDYDESGEVAGIEILDLSDGVDLDGLPADLEGRVGRALEEHNIKVMA